MVNLPEAVRLSDSLNGLSTLGEAVQVRTGSESIVVDGVPLCVARVAETDRPIHLIWAHGWGQSGDALLPMAKSLAGFGLSTVLDFPGFGASPPPPETWGTVEYADHVATWLQSTPGTCRVWIGHSFGCRVGLQIAARHPGLLSGMVLVAAAGLRPKRSPYKQAQYLFKRNLFRLAKSLIGEGALLNHLRSRMGSSDYRSAGGMRPVLSRVIAEDLSEAARSVRCPVTLIYGENDADTPVEMGRRLQAMIPDAKLIVLPDFDHHSILIEGRHQLVSLVKAFAEQLCR